MRPFLLLFILCCITYFGYTQPDPRMFYPERIQELTKQVNQDPFNYGLRWERLGLNLSLLTAESPYFRYTANSDTLLPQPGMEDEFELIYDSVILKERFEIVQKVEFYGSRFEYYKLVGESEQALADAVYLLDSLFVTDSTDLNSLYEYHLASIYELYCFSKQYDKALTTLNVQLDKEKRTNPEKFYGFSQLFHDKLKFLEEQKRYDELLNYLKGLCLETFDYYLSEANKPVQFSGNTTEWDVHVHNVYLFNFKQAGYEKLEWLVDYEKRLNRPTERNEKLLIELGDPSNQYLINRALSDEQIKKIVAKIK